MSNKSKHVTRRPDGRWVVRESGSERATKAFATQSDAIHFARVSAKTEGTEIYFHGRDGTITNKESYNRDPHLPKDRRK